MQDDYEEENRPDIKTRFKAGNKFWLARASSGRNPVFPTSEKLWDMCCEYFEWVDENPLYEAKAFSFQGESWVESIPKMRAMTKSALCMFLQVSETTWENYKAKPDFIWCCELAEKTIRDQKFTGASAGLLNPMIIARDLGLRETTAVDHSSADGSMSPKVSANLSDEQLLAVINAE